MEKQSYLTKESAVVEVSIAYPGFWEASLSKGSLFAAPPAVHVRAATAENWILVKFITLQISKCV